MKRNNQILLTIFLIFVILFNFGCKKETPSEELSYEEIIQLAVPPSITYPENNATDIPTSITFKWEGPKWADNKNHGEFQCFLCYRWYHNSKKVYVEIPSGISEYTAEGLKLYAYYNWTIYTYYRGALLSEVDGSFRTLQGMPPSKPILFSPSNMMVDVGIKPTLKWNAPIDPEGESLIYDVYLDKSIDPQTKILENQTMISLKVPTCLEAGSQYYWKVVAKDPEGNQTASEISSFTVAEGKAWVPDVIFRTYLKTNFPNAFTGDTLLYYHSDVTGYNGGIYVKGKNISSLKGIEYFTGITVLQCSYNSLYSLNVINNTSLKELNFSHNSISTINLNNNLALKKLTCQANTLASIDISKNTALTRLFIDINQLTSLDVSNNNLLDTLSCFLNNLTSLDLSNNSNLLYLSCECNGLATLDISNNSSLKYLICRENKLTSLNISSQTSWSQLNIGAGTGDITPCNLLTSLQVNNAVKNHQQFKDAKTRLPAMTIEVYSGGVKTCSNYDPNANGGTGSCITP